MSTTKTYTAKSSVTRALKAAKLNLDNFHINHGPEGWYAVAKEAPVVLPKEAGKMPRNGNCKKVWDIADAMAGARRKDVIAACVEAGINLGTAKTQYQLWFVSKK